MAIVQAYQTDEYAKELNDVGVSDGIETAEESVENRDAGAQNDGSALIHVDDDRERGAEGREDARRPKHLAAESGQKEEAAHPLAECVLKRIQHCHVPLLSHFVREENTTCDRIVETSGKVSGARGRDMRRPSFVRASEICVAVAQRSTYRHTFYSSPRSRIANIKISPLRRKAPMTNVRTARDVRE